MRSPLPPALREALVLVPISLVSLKSASLGLWPMSVLASVCVYLGWPRGDRPAPGAEYAFTAIAIFLGFVLLGVP
jgi:hypothetical protein